MKGSSHGETLAGEPAGAEKDDGPLYFGAAPRKNRLGRGIPVGHHQLQPLFRKGLLHQGQRGRHRHHPPPVAIARRHETAAEAGKVMKGCLIQFPGGAESGQFTITVPGRGVRDQAEGVQQPQGAQTHRADGGLGHMGGAQLLLQSLLPLGRKRRGGVDPVGETDAISQSVACIGLRQGSKQLGKGAGKIAEHPCVLGPLAGKEEGELARGAAACKEGAVRCLPG